MTDRSRRAFLHGLGAGAAAISTLGLPVRSALAGVPDGSTVPVSSVAPTIIEAPLAATISPVQVSPRARKFLFVFNSGGWDPLTVFAPMFGHDGIDMEPDAEPFSVGGLSLVDSPERPSVRAFFEQHHHRTAVLNGVSVRSLSHDVCLSICLTGNSSGRAPQWSRLLNSVSDGDPQKLRTPAEAVAALSQGVTRCATTSPAINWDTHSDNARQSGFFETMFSALGELMTLLGSTPGEVAPLLVDETVVVVMSEMGRTPRLNGAGGRDHWPYTSVMMVGPGIAGSRMIGGFDERFHGLRIDPATGEPNPGGSLLTAGVVGATLVQLAGGDHARLVPGRDPIVGLLA